LNDASPYRGLDRFEDRDPALFFGRDQLIKSLLTQLSSSPILLVLGASGSGKSSLVRAGLLPALSKLVGSSLRYFVLVPDVNPFESLRSSLISGGFSQSETKTLLGSEPEALAALIQRLKRSEDQWLLFIDQFEEIFTQTEESLREKFIAALVAIIRANSTKVILAMRADFLERLSPFPEFAKLVEKNNLVTDMHPDELRLAIEQPAAQHGVVFQQGLVEQIIKDVQGQAGSLPLLQYTLNLLWEIEKKSLANRTLNTKAYRELGGVRGALQKRADEIYASFSDSSQPKKESSQYRGNWRCCREVPDPRRLIPRGRHHPLPIGAGDLTEVESRFLDLSADQRDKLRKEQEEQRSRELKAAQKLAETERQRAEVERKARRRQRFFIIGLVVLLAVAGLVAVIAEREENSARAAASQANVSLALNSHANGNDNQELAYLAKALRLNGKNSEAGARTAALLTQESWPVVTGAMKHDDWVYSAHFSADGQRVVTASRDKTARVWDAATGKALG
jgi:energy-coupling factor transporter ATP-binding protein EcfA2